MPVLVLQQICLFGGMEKCGSRSMPWGTCVPHTAKGNANLSFLSVYSRLSASTHPLKVMHALKQLVQIKTWIVSACGCKYDWRFKWLCLWGEWERVCVAGWARGGHVSCEWWLLCYVALGL